MLSGTTFLQNISLMCLGSAAMFMLTHSQTKFDWCVRRDSLEVESDLAKKELEVKGYLLSDALE